MKKLIIALCLAITLLATSVFAGGKVHVNGYYRKDGTYVQPHMRSAPDGNPYNNWSTKGNVNPYTGQPGYKDPYPNSGYGPSNSYGSPYGSSYGNTWGNRYGDDD
ncbi:hypothetical protein [Desulfovibrio aminophilus]|uniref:hypothetical protein n=1 Tax=Desulfovibrio aminophilus TaxID=81425 RepID=UPI001B7FBF96|nr:hypothetical protein [Desulfovibrio aminophilus]